MVIGDKRLVCGLGIGILDIRELSRGILRFRNRCLCVSNLQFEWNVEMLTEERQI